MKYSYLTILVMKIIIKYEYLSLKKLIGLIIYHTSIYQLFTFKNKLFTIYFSSSELNTKLYCEITIL